MKKLLALSVILFISAITMIAISVILGESEFGLFIIFPFVMGSGVLAVTGAVLMFVSILLMFISIASQLPTHEEIRPTTAQLPVTPKREYGGVVMIGPFPIAFGSDSKIARIMMMIGILVFLLIVIVLILSALA